MGKKYFWFPVLVALYLFPKGTLASSPAGLPPQSAKEAFSKSNLVFLGKVESVTNDKLGFPSLANVRVEKIWKGAEFLSPLTKVDGSGGSTYPARLFKVGNTYLFYLSAKEKVGTFRADSYLQRVLTGTEAKEDLKYLSHFAVQRSR
jgi:hypothetical protein